MGQPRKKRPDADRRLRQAFRHGRTIRLLCLLLERRPWNARTLAAELECAERTVYRDLEVLSLGGVPWYFDEQDRCYRVRPDFRFPVISLSQDELLGQATATVITGVSGLDVAAGAKATTRRIAASTNEQTARLLQEAQNVMAVLDLKLADHSRSRETIRTAQWALLKRKQVEGVYASPYQEKPCKLTLHPYRLCLVKQAWYLIARADGEEHPKTYRVMRFKSLRMLDAAAVAPADFDLKAYFGNAWAVFRGNETFQVEIRFDAVSAPLVTETIWHATQVVKHHKDGSVTLGFTVDGLDEIASWVLNWSGWARILKPEELRAIVVERLQSALRLHSNA